MHKAGKEQDGFAFFITSKVFSHLCKKKKRKTS
jgi:hypothetical protein